MHYLFGRRLFALGRTLAARTSRRGRSEEVCMNGLRPRKQHRAWPLFELLEERTLLSAVPLAIGAANVARAEGLVADNSAFQLYELSGIGAGDSVTIDVNAESIGSALDSYLRVFHDDGSGLVQVAANDNADGHDSRLRFQAVAGGTYFIGVSASGNISYQPTATPAGPASIAVGATHGLFDLTVTRQTGTATPDLAGASFEIAPAAAAALDNLLVDYRIENRGAAEASAYQVEFRLSTDNRITAGDTLLATVNLGKLAAGSATVQQQLLQLPTGLTGTVYIGMIIRPTDGADPTSNNSNQVRGVDWDSVAVLTSVTVPAGHASGSPASLPINSVNASATVVAGTDDYYQVAAGTGQLTVRVQPSANTLLSLLTTNGTLLAQSTGGFIQQHVASGTYVLRVSSLSGSQQYRLANQFTAASDPLTAIAPGSLNQSALTSADFTGDGILDLAEGVRGGINVLAGLGDGSFSNPILTDLSTHLGTNNGAGVLLSADFNNDGITDLVTTTSPAAFATIGVHLGLGNGQFATSFSLVNRYVPALAVGDFNNDGFIDLVVGSGPKDSAFSGDSLYATTVDNSLAVFLGTGTGSFTAAPSVAGNFGGALAVGDFNQDGFLDVTSAAGAVLLGNGMGAFTAAANRPVATLTSERAARIVVRDLNGDGDLDLLEVPSNPHINGTILQGFFTVSYGAAGSTFLTPVEFLSAGLPTHAASADFNGDGRWDVATESEGSIDVRLGSGPAGQRTLGAEDHQTLPRDEQGGRGMFPAVGDFNRDGRVDVATLLVSSPSTIAIIFGRGDGSLLTNTQPQLGTGTVALVAGQFRNNGLDDLVGADIAADVLSVALSDGDGFFGSPASYQFTNGGATPLQPALVATGDFNRDGRLDLAAFYPTVPEPPSNQPVLAVGRIAVFSGVGDGSFQFSTSFAVNQPTVALASTTLLAADFNRDGKADLAIGTAVYLGNAQGVGFYRPPLNQTPQDLPGLVRAVGNFNNDDAMPDLIVENGASQTILRGDGLGAFTAFPSGTLAASGVTRVGHFDTDGIQDIAVNVVANAGSLNESSQIRIFKGAGNGTFALVATIDAPQLPPSPDPIIPQTQISNRFVTFNVADFDQDGRDDVAVIAQTRVRNTSTAVDITVYRSTGAGFAATPQLFALPTLLTTVSMAVGDFNGDSRPDLAAASKAPISNDDQLTVLLGRGDATFVDSTAAAQPTAQAIPLLADLNRDGTTDVVVLDAQGTIRFRAGTPGSPGVFEAPVVVNPGRPARDVALLTDIVNGQTTVRLAAVNNYDNGVSLYALGAGGEFSHSVGAATSLLPTRIASADLNGDGRGDLVVVTTGTDEISVSLADPSAPTGFGPAQTLALAGQSGPLALALTNLNQTGGIDIVATNANSGDVSVFLNPGTGIFGAEQRYRAGAGPFGLTTSNGVTGVGALAATAGLTIGHFNSDNLLDVVAVNGDVNTFSFLAGAGGGTLANARTFQGGSQPSLVVGADFNKDGNRDLAILNTGDGTIAIYRGDGQGNFFFAFSAAAGNLPTGFTVADIVGDANLDLVVGNQFGDVLILPGNGDFTFAAFVRASQDVPFVVADPDSDGVFDVFMANQAVDTAQTLVRTPGTDTFTPGGFTQTAANGLLAPGAVAQADLNGDNVLDLVIANTGSNNVLIYVSQANGTFKQLAPFVGTSPTGVTIADVNGGGLDIIVANAGSNDVSVLFGTGTGDAWDVVTPGLRLSVGAGNQGPMAVTVMDQTGAGGVPDGIVDLLVSNQSGSVTVLPGIGNGFFDDTNPTSTSLGSQLVQALTGGFIATTAGIFQANFTNLSFTQVFASTNLTAFSTGTIGGATVIFGGFNDGSIQLLTDTGSEFTASLAFRDASLTDPSALQVVNTDGQTEVYATNSGLSRVFVFGLADGISISGFTNNPGDFRGQLSDVTTLSQAGLALIATLVTSAELEALNDAGGDVSFVFGLGLNPDNEAALTALVGLLVGGDALDDAGGTYANIAEEVQFSLNHFVIGLEDALRAIHAELRPGGVEPGLVPFELPANLRTALDQAFAGLGHASNAVAGLWQGTPQSAGPLEEIRIGLGKSTQFLTASGLETPADGLQQMILSILSVLRNSGRFFSTPQFWHAAQSWAAPQAELPEALAGDNAEAQQQLAPEGSAGMWPAVSAALAVGLWQYELLPTSRSRQPALRPKSRRRNAQPSA